MSVVKEHVETVHQKHTSPKPASPIEALCWFHVQNVDCCEQLLKFQIGKTHLCDLVNWDEMHSRT